MFQLKSTFLILAGLTLTSLIGCAATATQESTGQYVDDSVITTRVKAAIFNDPSLKSAEINVETYRGRVQLSGFVSSDANIRQALQIARGISGVTSVKDDMRLK